MISLNLEIDDLPKIDENESVISIAYRKCYIMDIDEVSEKLGFGKPIDKYHFEITQEQYNQLEEEDADVNIEEGYFIKYIETTESINSSIGYVSESDIDYEYGDGLLEIMQEYEDEETDENGFIVLQLFNDSIDMNDINSVNKYLEVIYGIDDYNPLYILTDGHGLDSQTSYGRRGRDHHLTYDEGSYTLEYLVSHGAIRCMPESPGISISVYPNQLQQRTLFRWIRRFANKTFYIDFHDENGDDVGCTIEIPRLNVALFINNFDSIFQKGIDKLHKGEYGDEEEEDEYFDESVKKPTTVRLTENNFIEMLTETVKRSFNLI